MSAAGLRHFLDIAEIPAQELRHIVETSRAMKAARCCKRNPTLIRQSL